MSIYITRSQHSVDLTPRFRDLKLKFISSEVDLTVSSESINKYHDELLFIKKEFERDIITGSIALSLLGLIHRDIGDIDILIKDEKRYPKYINNSYGDDEINIENRLGFIKFDFKKGLFSRTKEYQVDFFKDMDANFIEFQFEDTTLKIQHPLEILSAKMGMTRSHKHYRDLEIIFYKFGC